MQIVIAVDDPFEVKQRICKVVAVLDDNAVIAVRIDYLVVLHRPYERDVAGCQVIELVIDPEDVLIARTYNDYLTVGVTVIWERTVILNASCYVNSP